MHLDHPLTRRQTTCPFCDRYKEPGLLACWECFKSSGLKRGVKTAEQVLDGFENDLQCDVEYAAYLAKLEASA